MEFFEKQRLCRRVCSGKLYTTITYQNSLYDVVFSDPKLDLSTQADWIYQKSYNNLSQDESVMTLEESFQILRETGKWNDDLEKEMTVIQSDLKQLYDKLSALQFNKTAQRAIKATIENGNKRLSELLVVKHQLYFSTIEHLSKTARERFIIRNITNIKDPELLCNLNFMDTLRVYYFEESSINESQIRELARSDPWRLYWTASKDTGTSLFPYSIVEITDLQYALIAWTKVYDFAFTSTNRPTDDVISDDTKFDSWYQAEVKRIDAENQRNSLEQSIGHSSGNVETFIPADEEGAKEVYGLNTIDSRARISQRQKTIMEKGSVKESELPDVSQEIAMTMNRLASQNVQNRS